VVVVVIEHAHAHAHAHDHDHDHDHDRCSAGGLQSREVGQSTPANINDSLPVAG